MKCYPIRVAVLMVALAGIGLPGALGADAGLAAFLRVYGEERLVNVEEEWSAFAAVNKDLVGGVKPKTTAFDAAIKRAHEMANQAVPRAKLVEARKRLPSGNDANAYLLIGARQAASGHLGATLACFVAAFDSDAKNAEAWFDLASCLALLNQPNEALAILQEMGKRGLKPDPAMGLTSDDVTDYERGYCLAAVGDKVAARKILEDVAKRQPLLSEASKLLALIDEAEGKNPRKNFLLGVWRRQGTVTVCGGDPGAGPEPDAMTSGEEVNMDLREILDMSKGRPGNLPPIRYAHTPEEAREMEKNFFLKQQEVDRQMSAVLERERAVLSKLKKQDEDFSPTWGAQIYDLIKHIDWRDKKLREYARDVERVGDGTSKAQGIRREQGNLAQDAWAKSKDNSRAAERAIERPFFLQALEMTMPLHEKAERLTRDTFDEWHRLVTAIGANIGDPGWREAILLRIESRRLLSYSSLLGNAGVHASMNSLVFEPTYVDKPGDAAAQDMAQCDGRRSIGISSGSLISAVAGGMPGGRAAAKQLLVEIGVEVNCEGLSVELGVGEGIQGSVEFGMAPKGGYNLFIGPRGTLALTAAPVSGTGVTTKGGLSISGNKGGITEVALKMETKMVVGNEGVTLATKVQEGSIVLISAPAPTAIGGIAPFAGGNP